ncbi:MAG: serine/threonine-protein kinase [Candidatus Methanoculleus thermohydrogenotrophicum]|jgi:hypothetical protein
MRPEPAGRRRRAAVLVLLSALILAPLASSVAGAGGPPEHANADPRGIEAASKTPDRDEKTPPGKSTDQNRGGDTPIATPAGKNPGDPGRQGSTSNRSPGFALLAAALVTGAVALAWHLKKPPGAGASLDHLPGTSRTMPSHPPGFPPELAERYDQVAFVGRGGLGQVFSAVRRDDGRRVAVKIPVTYDEETGKTFMKEMRFWKDLTHPNIVEVHSVNILPVPFVEMEYLPRTLGEIEKPLPVETAARIAAGIAAGLAYAHERGVIHRDIKPGNILLADDLTPKITDWGMSTTLERTRDTSIAGFTLAYAAPEQIAPDRFGRTDARTDIYQLGVVFYELVTGKPPFASEGLAGLARAILHDHPPPPSATTSSLVELDPIIMRCLAKDPTDRYQSARELQAAIETLMRRSGDTTLT